MNTSRRDEIEFELEWLDVSDAFIAAKANRANDEDTYQATKRHMSQMRDYWRGVGEALGYRTPVGGISVQNSPATIDDGEVTE